MGLDYLLERLEDDLPIILDGGMGTELLRRFANRDHPLSSAIALLEDPELITSIHREYIEAGAQIIRINSFLTAEIALRSGGLGGYRDELPELAFELAEKAVTESGNDQIILAASLGPLGSFFKQKPGLDELQTAHEKHMARLSLSGVEVAFCETMTSSVEAMAAIQAAHSSGMEAIVSFVPADARHVKSGETLDTAIRSVIPLNPLAICLNCADPQVITPCLATLKSITSLPVGAYASVPTPRSWENWEDHLKMSVVRYVRHVLNWRQMGAKVLGGCCGITPQHIKLMNEKLLEESRE